MAEAIQDNLVKDGRSLAYDVVSGVMIPRVKMQFGIDGESVDVSDTNPAPVAITTSAFSNVVLLSAITSAPTTGATFNSSSLNKANGELSIQASITGTDAVSATVLIEVSNDGNWVTYATITLSGTTTDTVISAFTPSTSVIRARLTAISGTSAAVTVTIGG